MLSMYWNGRLRRMPRIRMDCSAGAFDLAAVTGIDQADALEAALVKANLPPS